MGVIAYCPLCHGRLLAADAPVEGLPEHRLTGDKFYCPSCEMFVEPDLSHKPETLGTIDPNEAPPNPGRARSSGTNAGGSQRGDLADEGATQWAVDPQEAERNTWSDKAVT